LDFEFVIGAFICFFEVVVKALVKLCLEISIAVALAFLQLLLLLLLLDKLKSDSICRIGDTKITNFFSSNLIFYCELLLGKELFDYIYYFIIIYCLLIFNKFNGLFNQGLRLLSLYK
jgi:hypothetical protein